MKRNLGFYALGTAMLLTAASCSNDIPEPEANVYDGPTTTNYLTVNLVYGQEVSTRAAGQQYTGSDGTFEDGTLAENAVTGVRFYFFKADGEAAAVKSNGSGSFQSYYDWTPEDNKSTYPDDNDNVEKILQAEVVINTAEGDEIPSSIVAVVNPTAEVKAVNVTSINGPEETSLNNVVGNYANTGSNFMMSNSIYVNGGAIQEEVAIGNHLHTTPSAAIADPVTIYVERVNAKARTTVDPALQASEGNYNNETFPIYKVDVTTNPISNDAIDTKDVLATQEVYVRFLGWNVTCTTNKSNLMKEVSASWTNTGLFGTDEIVWNSVTRSRSYWAINPILTYGRGSQASNYEYGDFYDAYTIPNFSAGTTEQPLVNYTYLQENAGLNAGTPSCAHPTQLIVAGQLVDNTGAPLPLAEYGFNQYTPEGLLAVLAARCNVYTRTNEGGKYTYTHIDPENLEFVTAIQAGKGDVNTDGRYYAYVNLKEDAQGAFYVGTDPTSEAATRNDINDALEQLGHCKIWTSGYTYYYIDIQHLGLSDPTSYPATWGIVRNHIYAMNINSLTGLGTPVCDPEEVIYPEKPKDEDTYIGAQIQILNWRLVNQNVGFAW